MTFSFTENSLENHDLKSQKKEANRIRHDPDYPPKVFNIISVSHPNS